MKEAIANRLRQARQEAEFKRAGDAAESLGVPYQTYVAHENGNRMFDVEQAVLYARRFRVSLDWLLTGNGRGPGGIHVQEPIKGEVAIREFLGRVEGLSDRDIDVAFGVIQLALFKRASPEQAESRDQSGPANPRREAVPSR